MDKAGGTVRARNMQKRRARIVTEARRLLARGGFEALNLRDLARQAELTVPTIYNLIGKKDDVLFALAAEVLTEIEARIAPASECSVQKNTVGIGHLIGHVHGEGDIGRLCVPKYPHKH